MVGFDAVVGVLLGVMGDVEQDLVDYPRQRSGQIGGDLGGPAVRTQDRVEEPSRRRSVASLRHVHIDDLTVLIDRPVDVPPLTGTLT